MFRYKSNWTRLMLSLIAVTSLFSIAFQNCSSNVNLESALSEASYLPPEFQFKATICPEARELSGPAAKFIFIIDMSASNVGDWDKDLATNGKPARSYWDKTNATDVNGDRFAAVTQFLETCGSNKSSSYAILGFSKTAGIITGTGSSAALSCDNVNFVDATNAKLQLTNLKLAQDNDAKWYFQWEREKGKYLTDPNSPPILGPTSYVSALNCAKNITMKDFLNFNSNSTDNYHVIFISDGVPTDSKNSGCNLSTYTEAQKANCYLSNSLDSVRAMRQGALAKGRDLRLHGVFYGPNPEIPSVMDAISKEGGTLESSYLKSFEKNNGALCSLVLSQSLLDYQPENFSLINLTAMNKNGVIEVDSDMDGIIDSEESLYGADPQDPRSLVPGVLDGICKSLGGKEKCLEKRLKIQCLPDVYTGFGLTDCDLKMLNLNLIPDQIENGIDADKDGILDFVEIIKGTNPAIADMNQDPDNDGIKNRDELIQGSDVSSITNPDPLFLNHFFTKYSPPSEKICPYGGWSLISDKLQVAKTLENYNIPKKLNYLSHKKNQYVMLLLYRLTPSNAENPVSEYYYKMFTVDYLIKDGKEFLSSQSSVLNSSDFTLLGKVNP